MRSHQLIHTFSISGHLKKEKIIRLFLCYILAIITSHSASAAFVTYNGGTIEESNWQTAAGTTMLDDFEAYAIDTQITSLPELGIGFDTLAGGGFPNIYNHGGGIPYGSLHLANFPNGINEINRWDDIVLHVLPGFNITALGYWNGDGQSDTLVATAYDLFGNALGSVGAFKGTFAGFISDVSISYVVFDGKTGDGWNHLDGLQTNVVPIPAAFWLFPSALIFLLGGRRKV